MTVVKTSNDVGEGLYKRKTWEILSVFCTWRLLI